jgi:hypothetical protein
MDKRQERILVKTLQQPGWSLIGGPSFEFAETTLRRKFGYTDERIAALKIDYRFDDQGNYIFNKETT